MTNYNGITGHINIESFIYDYLIEKAILDCINDKNVLNFLIYAFMLSLYIED